MNQMKHKNLSNIKLNSNSNIKIMTAYYPKHEKHKPIVRPNLSILTTELNNKYNNWITFNRLKNALNSFKSKKSPGPDELKPIVFKHLPDSLVKQLQTIYKACIALGYTPGSRQR